MSESDAASSAEPLEAGAWERVRAELPATLAHYRSEGYAKLGKLASDATLEALRARCDAIMRGEIVYEGLFFQHDSRSGRYEDLTLGDGWIGPSLQYRKIEKLERDPLFAAWIRNAAFETIARAWIEDAADHGVTLYRAVLFSKGTDGGTELPWHQDGGAFWGIDRPATPQLWTALDDAPEEAGALIFLPRTHLGGLATKNGGVVPDDKLATVDVAARSLVVPARAGEVVMVHNDVWHRSSRNSTGKPRRALTVCLMSGATKCRRKKRAPRTFWPVFPARAATSPSHVGAEE